MRASKCGKDQGLTTKIYTVAPDNAVGEVASLMAVHDVGSVVVVDGGKPIGILTDRDIVVRVAAQMLDPEKVRVRRVMSAPPITVTRDEEVGAALALMRHHGIRRVPIVDETGCLFSIFTLDDVLLMKLAEQEDLAGIVRQQLRPNDRGEEPTSPARLRFSDIVTPSTVVGIETINPSPGLKR